MLLLGSTIIAGIVIGFGFALAALGITLIYRVTGVVNFAHGAMGMFSTFVAWQVLVIWHPLAKTGDQAAHDWPSVLFAVGCALLFSLLLGLVLENAVFRWLRGRPQLVKAVITIGVLLVLQAGASLLFGSTQYHQAIHFPGARETVVHFGPYIAVSVEKIIAVSAALVLAAALAAFLRFSRFGIAMRAVSDDTVAASLWGVPVNRVGSISWMLGSLVASIAGILITPFITFDTVSLTVLVVDALAAALIGGLVSLPLTLLGGFALGLLEAYPRIWIQSPGFPKVIAVVVILAVLLMRSERGLLRTSSGE